MSNKPYINDVGTELQIECESDLTSATVRKLIIKKPDLTEVEWPCTFNVTYPTKLFYIILLNDFDQEGDYTGQAYIENPDGKWRGETFNFAVYGEFE